MFLVYIQPTHNDERWLQNQPQIQQSNILLLTIFLQFLCIYYDSLTDESQFKVPLAYYHSYAILMHLSYKDM